MFPLLFPENKNELIHSEEHLKIILIDDNNSTNFFNKIVIERNFPAQITSFCNGSEALDHIKLLFNQGKSLPKFIFLDINMPVMNGWEFLSAYKKLTPIYKSSTIVFNLSVDLNKSDKEFIKGLDINYVFTEKMMTKKLIENIINS